MFEDQNTISSFRYAASLNPAGVLSNYTVTKNGISFDPDDKGGQIPTMQAVLADNTGDARNLLGQQVILRDWSRSNNTGRVAAYTRPQISASTTLDVYSIFEKLNADNTTTYPVITGPGGNALAMTLAQWCLMARVPEYRVPGNLLHYIDSNHVRDCVGYMFDPVADWRYSGPSGDYIDFIPSTGTYGTRLDANLSQGFIIGALLKSSLVLSETKLTCIVQGVADGYEFILRRDGTTYSLLERNLTSGTYTTLVSGSYTLTTANPSHFVMVSVIGNASDPNKADLVLRVIEGDGRPENISASVYAEFLAPGTTTKLIQRPQPSKLSNGVNSSLAAGRTAIGAALMSFVSEGTVLPNSFPIIQTWFGDYLDPTVTLTGAGEAGDNNFPAFVPGFTGNLWDSIKSFCSIYSIDVYFQGDAIVFRDMKFRRRDSATGAHIPPRNVTKDTLVEKVIPTTPARNVQITYNACTPEADYTNIELWRATSVYSIAQGEKQVQTVQTSSTFIYLNQPVPVGGVPVPYTSTFGSYVVTGADGYIVDPQWWKDNGGSLVVAPTGKAGEITITIQAPQVSTTRAPYRISEGAADRPALYILGYGLPSTTKTITVPTGNPGAAKDIGVAYVSPFITSDLMAYNVAAKLAIKYATADSTLTFNLNRTNLLVGGTQTGGVRTDYTPVGATYDVPPDFDCVYYNGCYYRIQDTILSPHTLSVQTAKRHNTIRSLNAEFATGKTVADWNTLHASKTINAVNIAPLPNYIG